MFKKRCRCGKTEKNFKIDIGPFFVTDCCEEEGFDCFGKKKEDYQEEKELQEESKQEEPEQEVEQEEKELEKMSQKELMALCDEKGLEYAKNASKKKLREMLKA